MRKVLLIIATVAVPLGIWTAGCRNNNRQAAFPNTPEMNSLAKAGGKGRSDAPPVIPPKPIDREILHMPEQGMLAGGPERNANARVQAVEDRGRAIASRQDPGMFTLPDYQNHVASAYTTPTYDYNSVQAAPAALAPVPSPREFWSRPARPLPNRPVNVPSDVAAMAAPAYNDDLLPPPPGRMPEAGGQRRQALLPPENVPGVFMGHDAAAYSGYSPIPDSPPPASGWIGMGYDSGDALGAPPLSSRRREIESRDKGRRKAAASEGGPIRLDLDALLGSAGTSERYASPEPYVPMAEPASGFVSAPYAVEAMPGSPMASGKGLDMYEPLPEPIPVEQYTGRLGGGSGAVVVERAEPLLVPIPLPEISPIAAPMPAGGAAPLAELPPSPAVKREGRVDEMPPPPVAGFERMSEARAETTLSDLMKSDNIGHALSPLPDISSVAKSPVNSDAAKAYTVSMPDPMPAPLPPPELLAGGGLMDFSSDAMDAAFGTDVWDGMSETAARALPVGRAVRAPVATMEPGLPPMVEMSEPSASGGGMSLPLPPPPPAEPRKIRLEPVSVEGARPPPGLEGIDTAIEAPPLRF